MSRELDRDLFILGNPINSPEVGSIRFLTYREYLLYIAEASAISMNILHIYNHYKKIVDMNHPEAKEFLDSIKESSLFDYILKDKTFTSAYLKIFSLVLDENDEDAVMISLEKIFDDEELFYSMRKIVMDMNLLSESPVSDNPEIQEYYETRMKMKQKDSGDKTASDIISSIVAGTPNSFEDVNNMTVIQLYSIYYRLGAMKSYDTSTLFATVMEKAEIFAWDKHIDLFAEDELGINYDKFNKQYGGLFD